MSLLHAKTVLSEKFWIVERDGEKFATLRKDDELFILTTKEGITVFETKDKILKTFGKDFFVVNYPKETENQCEVNGFPTNVPPYESMLNARNRLPLFLKSKLSKSLFCAGYYIIKFEKGWVKSFCPKLSTLQSNEYQGPFRTELEMKHALTNAQKLDK